VYSHWDANLLVGLATGFIVASSVLVHYEGLHWLANRLTRWPGVRRRKVLFGVYGVIILHVAEIWMFGACVWMLTHFPNAGVILGAVDAGLLEAVYLSATTFTTLGFGDVPPSGPIRFLTGTESVVGFILITWSASFLFLEMQEFWRRRA